MVSTSLGSASVADPISRVDDNVRAGYPMSPLTPVTMVCVHVCTCVVTSSALQVQVWWIFHYIHAHTNTHVTHAHITTYHLTQRQTHGGRGIWKEGNRSLKSLNIKYFLQFSLFL